jgi:predicted transposase YbfD/YdcC
MLALTFADCTRIHLQQSTSSALHRLSALQLAVGEALFLVRDWGIENTLHWCLDVTFREDENRVGNRTLADNMA